MSRLPTKNLCLFVILPVLSVCPPLMGRADTGDAVAPDTEPGIPVIDKLTVEKCGACHKADTNSNLTRISWIRTTPEGWEEAIKRMVRLNGLSLTPEEGRHILSYLAADHGLAPEETAAYRWYLEMRQPQTESYPSGVIRVACASCHAFARPETWRRSATEWKLLVNMHLGYFPVSEFNSFHPRPRTDGASFGPPQVLLASLVNAPPGHDPVDEALEYLTKNQTLHTSAWSNWRAMMKNPDLKGRWLVSATAPGKGKFFGVMTISPGPAPGSFKTETTLLRVKDGSRVSLTGQSVVYTGYEWRGRGEMAGVGAVRQVMAVSADQSEIKGRWFWGGYQEFGFNVIARRESSDVTVLGTDVTSVRAGTKDMPFKIFGDNFPKGLTAGDIDLGSGVRVGKVTSVKPGEVDALLTVENSVTSGFRSISVKGRTAPNAFAVYDKIDYIKINSDSALAHLGGTTHPKGYIQFEAYAYNRGQDGKANTADDINLGPVEVKWSMEEFIARYNDDDREFVGSISADGLFTPAGEGPNPQRRFMTNNTGDVWIVAKYDTGEPGKAPLEAKSYLAVTVPIYMKWDEPEVAE